jgi:hypothetical protein
MEGAGSYLQPHYKLLTGDKSAATQPAQRKDLLPAISCHSGSTNRKRISSWTETELFTVLLHEEIATHGLRRKGEKRGHLDLSATDCLLQLQSIVPFHVAVN